MIRLALSILILLGTIFSLIIMLVIVFPYDNSDIEAFMSSSENCAGICLMGIRPGISTFSETMQHLEAHPWVTDIRDNAPGNGYAQITWAWTGKQPEVIDRTRRGRITFYWDDEDLILLPDTSIETISIYTKMQIYALHKWLGATKLGTANIRPDGNLGYSVIYDIEGGLLYLSVELPCPSSLMAYWNAQTRLTMSIGHKGSEYVSPLDLAAICEEFQG